MKFNVVKNDEHLIWELGYASDNPNCLQKLDEATLNRIISKHDYDGYCIISACRSTFYKDGTPVPNNINLTQEQIDEFCLSGEELASINNKRTVELKKMLIADNHSFLPVYGGFKEANAKTSSYEKSFIVFNFNRSGEKIDMNDLINDCMSYGKKFNQDAILVKKPESHPYYLNCFNDSVDMEFDGDYTLNDLTQMYFTALKKFQKKRPDGTFVPEDELIGKPQRFTFEGVYINPSPISVHEATRRHYMNEIF